MQDYRQLIAWQKAHEMVKEVYLISSQFPTAELYGMTGQLRRAELSVPTNLAEGASRGTNADFARFVQISLGSSSEVDYLLLISFELGYISHDQHKELAAKIEEMRKVLTGLIKRLKA